MSGRICNVSGFIKRGYKKQMSRIYDALRHAEPEQEPIKDKAFEAPPTESIDQARDNGDEAQTINLGPSPEVEEKYQKLRGSLFGGSKKNRIKTLLVVASTHGEGATTIATFLASVLAKANRSRVLLVDANLRTPSFVGSPHINRSSHGLAELASGKASLTEVIQPAAFISPNLWVITGGGPLPSPSYLFDGDAIEIVLETLRDRYDYVILDGAPIRDYSDSCFLGSKVDGTIIVVEAGKTQKETARGTKRQLERYGAKVLGTVLNKKANYIPAFLERFL
jgi:capsular exopolysaccharide synthesis family protein